MKALLLALALVLALAPSTALARDTAGPALSGAYATDLDGAHDYELALGFDGRVFGVPALGASMDVAWAFEAQSAALDLRLGMGAWIATIDFFGWRGSAGVPGLGLAYSPGITFAVPFHFVGDASLASIFARFDYYLLGDADYPHQVVAGLRLVLDTTRNRR